MTLVVASRTDLTLDAVRRVAWEGEDVGLAPAVAARMEHGHAAFAAYVEARLADDPGALLYGVTTGPGDAGGAVLSASAGASRPPGLWTAASFGEPLPERVVRAIVLARLANLVDGTAGARPALAGAVAGMLAGPLPAVPARGNGGSGEILALGHLFGALAEGLGLEPREKMALINGSPCAAALVADAALAARGRLALAERTLALSVEAIRAPLDAFSPALGALWGDPHEADALRALSALLAGGAPERQDHQAPVSHRVLPRVLGRVREAGAHAERTAAVSLASVTDNPVFLLPDAAHPRGALVSNGGYHNDRAHPALDGLAHAWADLAQLAQRHVDKLFQHPVSAPLLAGEWMAKPLHMPAAGYAEEARTLAQTTVLGLGGFGQNDLPSPAFAAWGKADAVGVCLDRTLAVLAALASQALHVAGQAPPPALAAFLDEVRAAFPPIEAPRPLGPGLARLAAAFTGRVLADSGAVGPTRDPDLEAMAAHLRQADVLDPAELRELIPSLLMLEEIAVRDSPPFDAEAIAALEDANREMQDSAGDDSVAARADDAFHRLLTARCGNAHLLELVDMVRKALETYERLYLRSPERLAQSVEEHRTIIAALARGDHAAAADGVRANFSSGLPEVEVPLEERDGR